jgi:hypothetical protein
MHVEPVDLNDLFARSQVVFILAATTTENMGAIGASHFAAMRKGSVVVLIGRAGVVDFAALLDAAAAITSVPPLMSFQRNRFLRNIGCARHPTPCFLPIVLATFRKSGQAWAKWWLMI